MSKGPSTMSLNLDGGAGIAPFDAWRRGRGAHESVGDLGVAAGKALVGASVFLLSDPCLVGDLVC